MKSTLDNSSGKSDEKGGTGTGSQLQNEIAKKIDRVIRHNIIFSSLALTSALIGLTVFAACMWVALEDGTLRTDYLRIWGLFVVGGFDNVIGVSAVHSMTSGWIPSFILKRTKLTSEAGTTSRPNPQQALSFSRDPHAGGKHG